MIVTDGKFLCAMRTVVSISCHCEFGNDPLAICHESMCNIFVISDLVYDTQISKITVLLYSSCEGYAL